MAKVDRGYIDAEVKEEHTLLSELESDELDREHRQWDGHGEEWDNFNKVESSDDWLYDEPYYDWREDYLFPMHDDFYD